MSAFFQNRAGGLKPRALLHGLGLSALIACAGCAKEAPQQHRTELPKDQHWVSDNVALNLGDYTGTTTGQSCITGSNQKPHCGKPTVTHFVKGKPVSLAEAKRLAPCRKHDPATDYTWCA